MAIARDVTQDCTAAPASATTSTATFPGGACAAGRLIIAVAQLPTTASNVTVKGGTGFTLAKQQDDFSSATLIAAAKISAGTETGVTFTHTAAAGQIRVFGFQYTGALSPLGIDASGAVADDGTQHTTAPVTATGATVQANELVISAAALLGTGTSPTSTNGTIIANSGGSLFVAQRIVSSIATYSDTIGWTANQFRVGILFTVKAAATAAGVQWSVF